MNTDEMDFNPWLIVVALLALVGSVFGLVQINNSEASAANNDACANDVHFYAYDTTGNRFGPALAYGSPDDTMSDVQSRYFRDPVLLTSHYEGVTQSHMTDGQRQAMVSSLLNDCEHWNEVARYVKHYEKHSCATNPSYVTLSNSYHTQAMRVGADSSVAPTLFEVTPNKPNFEVVDLSCRGANGNNFHLYIKIDCGGQLVAQVFPGLPTTPSPPSVHITPGRPPHNPNYTPTTRPGCVVNCHTTTTRPHHGTTTTTQPHGSTTTTVYVCPPEVCYNEGPGGDVNNGGGTSTGGGTPHTTDTATPTATVVQPTVTFPPPAPPPPDPPQTTPVPTDGPAGD